MRPALCERRRELSHEMDGDSALGTRWAGRSAAQMIERHRAVPARNGRSALGTRSTGGPWMTLARCDSFPAGNGHGPLCSRSLRHRSAPCTRGITG